MAQTDKISNAGDVSIEDVTIITAAGFAQTITPQVIAIEIFEDVFSPFISGKLVVKESQDLTNLFPLLGEETVRLNIVTPSLPEKDAYKGEYFLYKLDDRIKTQERELVYVLHFISKEAINDLNTKTSRAYSGKVSDIVREILTKKDGLDTKKKVNIEETKNTTKFVSNFWAPSKNLQVACDNAVNENGSPSYVFFENKYALNFISLETLYTGAPLIQRFKWDNYSAEVRPTGGSDTDIEKDYQRVLELNMNETFDYIERIRNGMYGSEIIYYDLMTKQYVHKAYGPEFKEDKHLNDHPLYSEKIPVRSKAMLMLEHQYYNNFDGFDNTSNTKIIQRRKHLLTVAEAYKISITVWGRTDYSVGQRVYLEVPKTAQLGPKDDPIDQYMSGVYLISALCHLINRESHTCVIELTKDSFLVDPNDPK